MTSKAQTSMESCRRRYFHGLIRFFASAQDKGRMVPREWTDQYDRALFAAEGLDWSRENIEIMPLVYHLWLTNHKDYMRAVPNHLHVLLGDLQPALLKQSNTGEDQTMVTYHWFSQPELMAPTVTIRLRLHWQMMDYVDHLPEWQGLKKKVSVPDYRMWLDCTGLASEIKKIRQTLAKDLKWREEQNEAILAKKEKEQQA